MKKSTLITTIAMIVVVVVALSTATYAWFSSSTTSTAKTEITTNASTGWMLSQGNIGAFSGGTAPLSFSAAATQIAFTADMQGGLFSPKAAVNLQASNNEATGVTINAPGRSFYECKYYGSQVALTADKEIANPEAEAAAKVMRPVIIRIANNNDAPSTCYIDIIVSIGSTDSKAYRYAASAMTFVIVDGEGTIYTPGYSYLAHSATTIWGGTGEPASTALVSGEPTPVSATNIDTASDGAGLATRPDYNAATAAGATSGFKKCTTADTNFSDVVPVNDIYLKYRVNLGEFPVSTGKNLVIYSWMDGWKANDAAAGAKVKVVFSFGNGSTIAGEAVGLI